MMSISKYLSFLVTYLVSSHEPSYTLDNETWEPDPTPPTSPTGNIPEHTSTPISNPSRSPSPTSEPHTALSGRQAVEDALRRHVHVEIFPSQTAGRPVGNGQGTNTKYGSGIPQATGNPYAPFQDHFNWEIARWAKLRGPSSNALNELLSIEGVSFTRFF